MSDHRITKLEEQNQQLADQADRLVEKVQQLEEKVGQQQGTGRTNVTRRETLGLLGGGALLGAAGGVGTASAGSGDNGAPFADKDHDHSGDYLGESSPVGRIDAARLNGTHHLDPDAKDWGKAVNKALTEMSDGEVLKIPPVVYRTKTKAVIDKDITIVGDASAYLADESKPVIIKDADIPILEAQDASESKYGRGVQPRIIGLGFESAVEDTTPGAIFHGTTEIKRVTGNQLGSHVILLQQRAGMADNMNNCLVQDVSGSRCDGSVVRIENISDGASNVNAQRVEVRNAFRNNGWGIDADTGWGNYYSVQVMHGADDGMSGGIRLNTTRSHGRLIYVEPDMDKGIQFDDVHNTGEIVHGIEGLEGKGFVDNAGQNRGINYGATTTPDITKSGVPYTLSGGTSVRNGNVEITGSENGLVLTAPDGVARYQVTVGTDGSLTTELISEADYEVPKQSLTVDADVSELSDTKGLSLKEDFTVRKEPTVSGSVWVTWDESSLYLAADLEDDQHTQEETGNGAIYNGDILEMGVAPIGADSYIQIDTALTPNGPEVYKSEWPGRQFIGTIDVPAQIVRNTSAKHTVYEVGVPWNELPVNHTDGFMKMVLGYRDVDADSDAKKGRTGQYEWGDGMISGKDPAKLLNVQLAEQ